MTHDKFKIMMLTIALALTSPALVFSDVMHRQINEDDISVSVTNADWQPEGFENGTIIPAAYLGVAGITLDGRDDEPDWSKAIEVTVPLEFGSVKEASLKALYTHEEVFIRVRWQDETENREHHPWVWDAELGQYIAGPQIEDSLLLSFEAGCEWYPSFLAGYVYDFDAWKWLAARSDPLGQAVDSYGTVQSRPLPSLGFVEYQSRSTEKVWNIKFDPPEEGTLNANWDELDRTYYLQPFKETVYVGTGPDGRRNRPEFVQQLSAPEMAPVDETASYPQYSPLKLEGQAGEVSAKGNWENGFWTVEFRRVRLTPARTINDTVFSRMTQFSVHVYDQVERLDQASESARLFLRFMDETSQLDENQLLVQE
jgi:hypothetical protein